MEDLELIAHLLESPLFMDRVMVEETISCELASRYQNGAELYPAIQKTRRKYRLLAGHIYFEPLKTEAHVQLH